MSMLSAQCDELRAMAESVGMEMPQAATLMMEAADTILELRDDLQCANDAVRDAEHDESRAWDRVRKAEAENDKLREVVSDDEQSARLILDESRALQAENTKLRKYAKLMHGHIKDCCDVCDEYYCSSWDEDNECCVFDSYMRELGVEVK